MARSALALLALNLVLFMLASCSAAPLQRATASPPSPSATPVSSLTVYAGLNTYLRPDVHPGALVALRADSGAVRWRASLDAVGGMSVGATLGAGVIYAASRDVFAMATHDGMLLWHTPLAGIVYDPPTLSDGVLFVPRAGYTQGDVSRNQVEHVDASVYAVRARDGVILWRSLEIVGQVVVNNGIVYGRSYDSAHDSEQLIALHARDGSVLWHTSLGPGLVSIPILVGDTLYAATSTGDVAALRTSDGSLHWKVHLADRIFSAVTVSDGVVYTTLSDLLKNPATPTDNTNNALVALRASDGTQLWRVPNGERDLTTPRVTKGVLYIGDGDGISARRTSDGTLLWHVRAADLAPVLPTSGPQVDLSAPAGTPDVADGQLFAIISVRYLPRGGAYVIVALDAQTGAVRWRYPQDDSLPGFVGSLVVGP